MSWQGNRTHAYKWVNDGTTSGDRVTLTTVPTQLCGVQAFNLSTGINIYLHFFDSTTPMSTAAANNNCVKTLVIPSAVSPSTAALVAGLIYAPPSPISFSSGLTFSLGSNLQSSAAFTTVAASLAVINLDYEPARDT
jgi:hypothetical protein